MKQNLFYLEHSILGHISMHFGVILPSFLAITPQKKQQETNETMKVGSFQQPSELYNKIIIN